MSRYVDNHYNRCSLLESQEKFSLVGWLAVEVLALKMGGCFAVSWLAGWR
jgi:hypothetical protein